MSGAEAVSLAAAATQIAHHLIRTIETTRKVVKDFKSAPGDHEAFSQEFASISKIIEFTSNVLRRAAGRLTDAQFQEAMGNHDIEPLLDGIRKNIQGAQKFLHKYKTDRFWDKVGFVRNKGDLQTAQVKLSHAGMQLTMFLTSLLVDAVVGGSSQAPLTEVLTRDDVKASLEEVVKSVAEEAKLGSTRGMSRDSSRAANAKPRRRRRAGRTRRKVSSKRSGSRKDRQGRQSQLRRNPSTLSDPRSKSAPQPGAADPVPVAIPEAGVAKHASKTQEVPLEHTEQGSNNGKQAESPSAILGKTRRSRTEAFVDSLSSPLTHSPKAKLETQGHRTSWDSLPQDAAPAKDDAAQASLMETPSTGPPNDDEMQPFEISSEASAADANSLDGSSGLDNRTDDQGGVGGRTSSSSPESSQEPYQSIPPSYKINFALEKTRGLLTSTTELLGILEKMDAGRRRPGSPGTAYTEQALFADATWISASIFDVDDDDDEEYDASGVLVFQRPDNWLQLAKIPKDHQRPASLLSPIVEAMENTPILCNLKRQGANRHTLRLFFFMNQDNDDPQLSICSIALTPTLVNATWDVRKLQLSSGDDLPPPMSGMGFFASPCHTPLSYASSSRFLISVDETDDGEWETFAYPEEVGVQRGDQVVHTTRIHSPVQVLRIYRQNGAVMADFNGLKDWKDLADGRFKRTTKKKSINWHGLTLDQSSIPCLPILREFLVGLVCKTVEDDVYLFKGHPWRGKLGEPKHLCKVKSGTNISFSYDFNDLFFISTESELSRIRIQASKSDITFTRPSPLFPKDASSTRLDGVSFPGVIVDHILTNQEDGDSSTSSSYTGPTYSDSSSSRSTHRTQSTRSNSS